jgi:membrane dipeptidase
VDQHARAEALLTATPLVDGHNDLPWALRRLAGPDPADAVAGTHLTAGIPALHTDLPRLRAGRVGVQFWSVYVPCSFAGADAVTAVLEQVELVHRLIERYPADLGLATTADEAEAAFARGRVASLLGAEGGHGIGGSLGVLRALRRLGVRYLTLTHNLNTDWADSATDEPVHSGLTDFGRDVVREMNRIGMVVDLSHVAATTMRDALATTAAPVLFTHSSCRAVTDHPRNVPDDVLAALPGNGGVCMVTFVPRFVSAAVGEWDGQLQEAMTADGVDHRDLRARDAFAATWDGPPCPRATLADVVAHVEHAREVAGIDHIGLGGDYDGTADLPVGLEDVSRYPALFGALLERGWSEEDCAKLAGRNALRVLRAADDVAVAG